jgi:peptidoglycan hydrolase-like protein with peptidoglycan-binding domain
VLQWSQAGRGPVTALPAATDTITDLRALADGRLVFGTAEPAFGVLGANSSSILSQGPVIVDSRRRHAALQVSHDGLVVEFGFDTRTSALRQEGHLARLQLAEGQLLVDPPPLASSLAQIQQRLTALGYNPGPADGTLGPRTRTAIQAFQRARGLGGDGVTSPALQRALGVVALTPPRTAGLAITNWEDSEKPKLDRKPLPLKQYETSYSLAIAPDASRFLLGTAWYLRLFDRRGQQVWEAPVPSDTWAVNITGDGRLAVAAFGDGTLRWYRLGDGAELLALFLHADRKRWVMWTPEGFFNASPGGETLVGYHLNQGPEAAGEFVTIEQLYRLFYRPELVARRLAEGIEPALQEALASIGNVRQVLTAGLPPALELLSPQESRQRGRDFIMEFKLAPKNGGLGRIVYRVNGVVVGDPGARPTDIAVPHYRRPFTLQPGRNVLSVTATNAAGTVESPPIETVVHVQADERQPALYGLAIGVTNYRDSALKLRYAAQDATVLAETLRRQGGRLFTSVLVEPLLDANATRERIDAAFRKLTGIVQEHDVFVLYLAGHGTVLDGEYHFLPADLVYANQQTLRTGSVRQDQLVQWLSMIKAQKSLVILDTCHAGTFVTATAGETKPLPGMRTLAEKGAIDRLMRASGRATIASSSEQQFALEGHENHGVFTYALLQGLRGAAKNRDGEVTVPDLMAYVAQEVPQLTLKKWGYEQFPMHQFQGRPFAIGLVQP